MEKKTGERVLFFPRDVALAKKVWAVDFCLTPSARHGEEQESFAVGCVALQLGRWIASQQTQS
jgi:hypothetical protein